MKYLIFILLFTACASKPKLYPNQKFKQIGPEGAQQAVNACMHEADGFVGSEKGKKMLRGAGQGATIGGVMGGVASGILSGNILKGALRGAAVGAAGGATAQGLSPDQLKRSYVNRCLNEQGLEVLGWN